MRIQAQRQGEPVRVLDVNRYWREVEVAERRAAEDLAA